jgi:hypothetical protein
MADTTPAPAPVAAPPAPAVSDLLPALGTMTVEQAQAKRVEYLGDAKFRDRVVSGDPESVRLWRDVTRALSPQADPLTAEGKKYNDNMNSLAILRAKADLSDAALDWTAAGGPVSLEERRNALFAKERNFKDKAWVQRYLDGDRAANSEMTLINITLASRVGTFDEIEAFKAAAAKRLAANGRAK